jgi:hypothetical protein
MLLGLTPRLVPPAAQDLEASNSPLVAAHHLAIDETGTHLEVVHGLYNAIAGSLAVSGKCRG